MLIYDIKIYREKFMKSLTLSLFSFPLSKYSIALGLLLIGSKAERWDFEACELTERLSSATLTSAPGCWS